MSFVWIEGTAVGDIIHKADIDEIKTNIDSIKDNLANITHDVTDNSNEKGTHNATKYTTHDATQYTGRDSGHYTSNDAADNGNYYSTQVILANSVQLSQVYNYLCTNNLWGHYTSVYSVHNNWRKTVN